MLEEWPLAVVLLRGGYTQKIVTFRLRRLDESAQIIMFEKGPHVSFASCGLPYYIGDVIQKVRINLDYYC